MKFDHLFYFCDSLGSVFDSQVVTLLKAINNKGFFKRIYLFLGVRNKTERDIFLAKKLPPEIRTVFFKSYPSYPLFNFMNRESIRKALHSQNTNLEKAIFHTRGEMTAFHLSKFLGTKYCNNIIPDIRGASIEEINEFSGFNKISKTLKIRIKQNAIRNLKKFCKISVVSNSLKEYLINNYNIDAEKISIIPCLVDSTFKLNRQGGEKIRKEFNLSGDDLLLVFSSGGTANWQKYDAVILLANKGIKVLNLSKKEVSHKNIFNKFVSYDEMPMYLNSADAAIIFRDKSVVNKVASPVKFGEYICCGLPVIANHSVDMINEYLTQNDCGILINNIKDVETNTINSLKKKDRKKIAETGILNFGIDTIVDKYLQTYSSVCN